MVAAPLLKVTIADVKLLLTGVDQGVRNELNHASVADGLEVVFHG